MSINHNSDNLTWLRIIQNEIMNGAPGAYVVYLLIKAKSPIYLTYKIMFIGISIRCPALKLTLKCDVFTICLLIPQPVTPIP